VIASLNPTADLGHLYKRFGQFAAGGEIVVRHGDPSDDLFFVLNGRVQFFDHDRQTLGTAGPGELFGEVACFTGLPRSAEVAAVEDTMLLRFDRTAAYELVQRCPAIAVRIIANLSDRLRARTEQGLPSVAV
jgi:CRP-like cAMP-binding protein